MLPPGGGILLICIPQLPVSLETGKDDQIKIIQACISLKNPLSIYFPVGNSPLYYSAKMTANH